LVPVYPGQGRVIWLSKKKHSVDEFGSGGWRKIRLFVSSPGDVQKERD
jgi:hypothetical protein